MLRLKNKVAKVTGGVSRIGNTAPLLFAQQKTTVCILEKLNS